MKLFVLLIFLSLFNYPVPVVAQGQTSTQADSEAPVVDLRKEFAKHKLTVRSQGQRGACQVFAMVGTIEFQLAQKGVALDLSEQYLMWASNQASGQTERTKGFNPDRLIAGLMRKGICIEAKMPYVPRNEKINRPKDDAIRDAKSRTYCTVTSIKHWSSPIGFSNKHFQRITSQLKKGVPVTATFCWPEGLSDKKIVDNNHFIVDKKIDGTSKNGHGVVLVGYGVDDQFDGGGYFILRNSWGVKFGDKGYAKVSFQFAKKYGIDAYIVSLDPDSDIGKTN